MSNHVNSCILCVCLLFDFRLFTVIDLSLGALSAQHHDIGKIQIYSVMLLLHQSCSHFVYYRIKKLALLYAYAKKWAVCMDCCVLLLCSLKNKKNVKVCTVQRCSYMGNFSNDLDANKSEDHGLVQIKEMKKKVNFLSR